MKIEIQNEEVILHLEQNVAGALSAYAGGNETLKDIRDKA